MGILIVCLGFYYITIGILFLFGPIIYLELGRSKDLMKASLNLFIGFALIIKNKIINESFFVIFLLLTLLVVFYQLEIFLSRWNQLTEIEKRKLTTFMEFKNNLSKILEAIKLGTNNFMKPLKIFNYASNNKKTTEKKWVRNDKNDNISV